MKAFLIALLASCALAPVAHAQARREVPLDAPTLSALPREQAAGTVHGERLACEGVTLLALLRATGAMPSEALRGQDLSRIVRVEARDGYRAVFGLAELDPTLGARKVLLADRCNGASLGDDAGPLRMVVPDDARPARWVRQVRSISVMPAP